MPDEKPDPGYTISLHVSRVTEGYTSKDRYGQERTFPRDTVELGRVELRGSDLAVLLAKTKSHIDLVEET